jgi:hypothetical protein
VSPDATPVTSIELGGRPLGEVLPEVDAAIARALQGEAIDLLTTEEVVAKYAGPAAAVGGARAGFRRDASGCWRVELRSGSRRSGPAQPGLE